MSLETQNKLDDPEFESRKNLVIDREALALECIADYYTFFKTFWLTISTDNLVENWHLQEICDILEEFGRRLVAREVSPEDLIINIPPSSSKSSMVSQLFPVWLWLLDPTICTICSSYSGDLSIIHSNKSKAIVQSELFHDLFDNYYTKQFGSVLYLASSKEKFWTNNFGGFRASTSTGGTIQGIHAHLIIRDDPISDEQAESPAYRKRANRFNDRTLYQRKKDPEVALTITVMQRLHHDDTTGHDMANEDLANFLVCLPATLSKHVKPDRFKEMYIDGMLDPKRLSVDILKKKRAKLGTFGYAGQFDQNPVPEGGNKVQRHWFQYLDPFDVRDDLQWDLWIDGAYTESTKNDPSGLWCCAYDDVTGRVVVKHAESVHKGMPDILKYIPEYMELHGINPNNVIYIEPKASGLSMIQMLRAKVRNDVMSILGYLVSSSKEVRINVASPKIESGRMVFIRGSWNKAVEDQLCDFPAALHDEYVDLSGYSAYHYLVQDEDVDADWD